MAVLGVTAYRAAFARPGGALGRQPEPIGPAVAWVLPNPSGLNAHHRPADLARLFGELHALSGDGQPIAVRFRRLIAKLSNGSRP